MTKSQLNLVGAVVVVLGILALAAGVIYFTVDAKSLPSFMGQLHTYSGHRSHRGIAAVVVGIVLLVAGAGMLRSRPRPVA
jgi:dipeptide/tripeptide permease